MEKEFELIAKTFQGLEQVLARELTEIGANNIQIGRRMVSFTGTKETMYRANYALHTAIRILKPLKHFKASTADEVYEAVKDFEWNKMLNVKTTFAVDSVVYSENFRYSKFVAYKVKDAIVDYFRETENARPNISVTNPDIRFHIHISDEDCTLSLDSSGESLHHRGYRTATVEAPINEVLAAGLIKLTNWDGECDFIDPMCGSGTIAIEADLIARNIAPGKFRKVFAFEKWADFNSDLYEAIKENHANEREFAHKIYAYDVDADAIAATKANVSSAGLDNDFVIDRRDFHNFAQPEEKAIMVMNPPYGVRISSANLLGLYRTIGERLKHQFVDNDAWIISNHEELFDNIGLKPSLKIPLFNGSLDCQFQKYQIFSGKFDSFRSQGNDIKTDEERRTMAEKHRFKAQRDFNKKVDEENDEDFGDIPDYVVRKHREFEANERRKEHRSFDGAHRDDRRSDNRFEKRDDRDHKGDRPPFKRDDSRGGGYSRSGSGYSHSHNSDHQEGGYGHKEGGYKSRGNNFSHKEDGYGHKEGGYSHRDGGFGHKDSGYGHKEGGYGHKEGGYGRKEGDYGHKDGGYGRKDGGYGHKDGGFSRNGSKSGHKPYGRDTNKKHYDK